MSAAEIAEVGPASFSFDDESNAEIAAILAKYPPGRQASGVIPLLYVAQKQMRRLTGSAWVPRVAMDAIGARLGMAPIRVYEVATFYYEAGGEMASAALHHHALLAARLG
jgi:NADH-quinone oxidoreductase subunit E